MRVLLYVATNFAIMMVLWVVIQVLGLDRALAEQGFALGPLFAMCAIFGVGGSFISLLISKWMAKRATGARVIDQPSNDVEAWLVQTVSHHAQAAGIGMPEVAIFPSEAPNAFATGASRDKALVAVSEGLLQGMDRSEVEAVLGHEVSHVANGDMITLALIQGVLNTFVYFLARVIGYAVDQFLFRNNDNRGGIGMGYFMVVLLAQVVLGLLASIIVAWFSRRREFRADAGGARLAGRGGMVSALARLKAMTQQEVEPLPASLKAFGISGGGGMMRLFMSHPPLDERIAALKRGGEQARTPAQS
jgi:heat shock protein HtpX